MLDQNHDTKTGKAYLTPMRLFSTKTGIIGLSLLLGLDLSLASLSHPLFAQRSRRSAPATTKKPATTTTQTTKAPGSEQTLMQLEERNKELVKQILDLQYERDFYKKKITEWTEMQKVAPQEESAAKSTAPAPQQPIYIPYPMGGFSPTAVSEKPKDGKAPLSRADSLLNSALQSARRGRLADALNLFETLIKLAECQDRHFLEYGKLLYKLERFQPALAVLNNVVDEDSLIAVAAYYRGRIHQEHNAFKLAEIEFYRSQVLGRSFRGHQVARAYQFLIDNQPDSARQILEPLTKTTTGLEAEIYAALAEISYRSGDRQQEITYLQRSLVYDPLFQRLNADLGLALFEVGEYQSSLLFLKRLVPTGQEQFNLHYYLGQCYYQLRQWDVALAEFRQIDPRRWGNEGQTVWVPKIYFIKSLLAKSQSNFREATDFFRKAREVNPDAATWMEAALTDLAGIYENEKKFNSALDYYSQRLRLNPANPQTLLKLGEIYYLTGDFSEAKKVFIQALSDRTVADKAEAWLRQIDAESY